MIGHLARMLGVPPREQNGMFLAAGYAPVHPETPLTDLGPVREAVAFMLRAHEPNPAVVLDRCWNVVDANSAALRFTTALSPEPPLLDGQLNLMALLVESDGLRGAITNWDECAPGLAWRLADDAATHPGDPVLAELSERLRRLVPGDRHRPDHAGLITAMRFDTPAGPIALFTCLATLEAAHDVTIAELRLETFFPADADSARNLADLLAG